MDIAYDTLDSKPGAEFLSSFEDVKRFVLGPILEQNYCADMMTGSLRLNVGLNQPSLSWGVGYENDVSTVYIRSYPKGRIGLPLERWETRIVLFRILDLKTKRSKVTVVRFFLMDEVFPPTDQKASDLARDSYGPLGVPLVAMTLFSKHRSMTQRNLMQFAHSSAGYHFVIPSVANISSDPLGNQANKLVVAGSHDVAIASYIGIDIVIDRIRRPIERGTHQEWAAQQSNLYGSLAAQVPPSLVKILDEDDKDAEEGHIRKGGKSAIAADYLYGSKMLCDLSSAPGLLDLMSLDISTGALPDIFSDPSGLPLVLAILTRIAAYPGRFRMESGTKNDIWAAREIARAFEECNRPIMIVSSPADWVGNEHQMYAIDIAANLALNNVRENIVSAMKRSKKNKNSDAFLDSEVFSECMETLFHHACTLMIDVAAPTGPDTYTVYGNANKVMDPVEVKRLETAQALGMGCVGKRGLTTLRCSHRSQRQKTLLMILRMVENWLKDGKVNGVQVCTTNQHNPRSKREKPNKAKQDCNGHVPVPSYSARLDVGAEFSEICLDAMNTATTQLEILFTKGPALFFTSLGTDMVIFSKRSRLGCANCANQMDAITAFALSTVEQHVCQTCSRPRCQDCLGCCSEFSNCLRCAS